eukprot:5440473-Amphidinium_carterae.1
MLESPLSEWSGGWVRWRLLSIAAGPTADHGHGGFFGALRAQAHCRGYPRNLPNHPARPQSLFGTAQTLLLPNP